MRKLFYFVYILASKKYGTLYIGVTSNLIKRVWRHRNGVVEGFTKQYNVSKLTYYEVYEGVEEAIKREKQLKKCKRDWKIELIERDNPDWLDMYQNLVEQKEHGSPRSRG